MKLCEYREAATLSFPHCAGSTLQPPHLLTYKGRWCEHRYSLIKPLQEYPLRPLQQMQEEKPTQRWSQVAMMQRSGLTCSLSNVASFEEIVKDAFCYCAKRTLCF